MIDQTLNTADDFCAEVIIALKHCTDAAQSTISFLSKRRFQVTCIFISSCASVHLRVHEHHGECVRDDCVIVRDGVCVCVHVFECVCDDVRVCDGIYVTMFCVRLCIVCNDVRVWV